MARLLAAAVSLKLVDKRRRERFGLGSLGVAMVGNPGLLAMVQHHQLLYADLRDPVALLRGTHADAALAAYWPYADAPDPASLGADAVGPYTALMAASQPFVADEILDAYDFGRHRCLLDVGGGDGSFLRAVAARHPKLELMLFDLPAVAARARGVRAFGGDFTRDALPRGADIVSLVRIAHDHGDDTVLTLLRAIRRALPRDGVVLIGEPMSGVRGAEAMGDAYFGFYLLAMGRGRARSFEELSVLLDTAGFAPPRRFATHTPLLTSVIVAGLAKSNQTVSLS
jgi:demethylspheroidene O-methyltransferase